LAGWVSLPYPARKDITGSIISDALKYVKDKTEKLNEVAKTSAYEEEGKRVIVYGNPMRPAMKSIDAATRRSFCVLVSSGTIIADGKPIIFYNIALYEERIQVASSSKTKSFPRTFRI
jgi:hypothetical protein